MRIATWILCILVILVPTLLLQMYPETYKNPVVVFLLSVAVAVVTVVASRNEFLYEAKKRTQTEWLSQAESACDRLLTTKAQVVRLRNRTLRTCDDATSNLPELQQNNMKAVRTLIERNCENTGEQLHDVSQHIDSALADWQRFIRKNCEGDECEQINTALERRRADLNKPIRPDKSNPCISATVPAKEEPVTATTSSDTEQGVSGVQKRT